MSGRRDMLMVGVALVAGLIGGAGSSWVFMSRVMVVQTPTLPRLRQLKPEEMMTPPTLPAEVIQAQRLQVVNAGGRVLADLGADSSGDLALSLLGNDGAPRAKLAVEGTSSTPSLSFYSNRDDLWFPRLHLSLSSDEGSPLLSFSGGDGGRDGVLLMTNTGLFINRVGYGHLDLGVGGKIPWSEDKEGKIHYGVEHDIGVRIELSDADSLRAVLGQTNLEITRTGEGIKRPVSSLVLFGKDGKVLWQAP